MIMTEEQIKQNAKEIAKEATIRKKGWHTPDNILFEDAYIAGVHSRDEEIKELKERLKYADESIADADKWIAKYKLELHHLRNPWVSAKDRLPENNCVVFVSLDGTEYLSAHYRAKSKRFFTVNKDKQTLVEVRKSAATYTVCGDCIKEERLYSEGEREDITAIVTHWMPITNLKKGNEYES